MTLNMDLRDAMRGITRSPGFAALIGATMALGIGANTTMFAVIRAVFLRPLPVPDDDRRQGERHVVISDSYWRDHLAADSGVLGKTIEIDTFRGGKFEVIGVMPHGFDFPRGASLWLSLGDWGGGPLPPLDMAE